MYQTAYTHTHKESKKVNKKTENSDKIALNNQRNTCKVNNISFSPVNLETKKNFPLNIKYRLLENLENTQKYKQR